MTDSPLTLARGYGYAFGIRFTTTVDLTQCEITWVLADASFRGSPIRITKTLGQGIGLTGPDSGIPNSPWIIAVDISEDDTVNLAMGTYYHECKVVPPSSESHCPARGTVTVLDSPIPPLGTMPSALA